MEGLHREAGGGVSKERRVIDRVVTPIGGGAVLIEGKEAFTESKFTYKLGIDYAFTPTLMVYASHSTGYRPGSFASTYASPRGIGRASCRERVCQYASISVVEG